MSPKMTCGYGTSSPDARDLLCELRDADACESSSFPLSGLFLPSPKTTVPLPSPSTLLPSNLCHKWYFWIPGPHFPYLAAMSFYMQVQTLVFLVCYEFMLLFSWTWAQNSVGGNCCHLSFSFSVAYKGTTLPIWLTTSQADPEGVNFLVTLRWGFLLWYCKDSSYSDAKEEQGEWALLVVTPGRTLLAWIKVTLPFLSSCRQSGLPSCNQSQISMQPGRVENRELRISQCLRYKPHQLRSASAALSVLLQGTGEQTSPHTPCALVAGRLCLYYIDPASLLLWSPLTVS